MDTLGKSLDELIAKVQAQHESVDWDERERKIAADLEAEETRRRKTEAREKFERMLQCGFPRRCLEGIDSFSDTPAMLRARSFRQEMDEKCLLVLSGGVGCGKTVAAAWLARMFHRHSRFLRAATFASSSRYNQEQREEWLGSQMLVLDDLGAEYADAKGSFLVDLDELLDKFYGDRRYLIITTNLDAATFKTRYGGEGGRIVSRIREAGAWANCNGPDMRKGRPLGAGEFK